MDTQKIDYDIWANTLILNSIKSVAEEELQFELTRLFAHLFKAQIIWFNRVYGIKESVQIWGTYTIEECISLLNDSTDMLSKITEKAGEIIEYHDLKGNAYSTAAEDIFEHVIIHGQHHRAQILYLLSKNGYKAPATDYIYFLRSLQTKDNF
ncbi:MAG: hypothetical protein JJ895_08955 [Balneolaceae bacterium]|nr:hypothetical protein [Balneolaceae bacterium]